MWLCSTIDVIEYTVLHLHRLLHLPGIIAVILFSYWESAYCLLHRFFPSQYNGQQKIAQMVSAHQAKHSGQKRRLAVVTGAANGIGYETAKALGMAGYTTILACRNMKRAQCALGLLQSQTGLMDTFEVMELDLASFTSIKRFTDEFSGKYQQLHVLCCNAGVAFNQFDTTYDGIESQFGTNYVGHFVLIDQLLPIMKQSGPARITIASSIAACMVRTLDYKRVTDIWRYDRFINYSTSKLALMMLSATLARRLKDSQVTVNAFHPSLTATGLYRHVLFSTLPGIHQFRTWLWLNQVNGSVTSVYLALSDRLEGKTGGYYAREQPTVVHPDALSVEKQDRLWKFTEVLVAANTHEPTVLSSINTPKDS